MGKKSNKNNSEFLKTAECWLDLITKAALKSEKRKNFFAKKKKPKLS